MRSYYTAAAGLAVLCLIGVNGCAQEKPAGTADVDAAVTDGHEHEHDLEGPHGGHIIELGTESHHAELTHDAESNLVGVYILGRDAKTAAPIDAESVMINVSVDGEASQYELKSDSHPAVEGKASYFKIESEPLHEIVSGSSDAAKLHARLNVEIDGKPYVGIVETSPHEHDHDHAH